MEKIERQPWQLWYSRSASKWEEALPIGNGRLGGMVYGGERIERILLNEDTLWSGFPRDTVNYEALRYLKSARKLILEGNYAEAEELVNRRMLGLDVQAYQPLGELNIEHIEPAAWNVEGYTRALNIESGIATVDYTVDACKVRREAFVSAVDHALVVRYDAEAPILQLKVSASSLLPYQVNLQSDTITLQGKCPSYVTDNYHKDHPMPILFEDDKALSFQFQVKVIQEGGQLIEGAQGEVIISDAHSVTMVVVAATDFIKYDTPPGGKVICEERCIEQMRHALSIEYSQLRERHIADHIALFQRVDIDLGSTNASDRPTDERLVSYQAGGVDPELEALYFQYGRYLLMASSRPGTQPANLQGIWNDSLQPPWKSDYTTNINTQMNYWPAEVCALEECHEPLLEMLEDLAETGKRTAAIHYGARGWTAHHNVDLWRASTPSGGEASWAFWPVGGAWLARHLWDRYLFNLDLNYLKQKAYPLLKGSALFALDWLVEGPNGDLVTMPSTSPENKFISEAGEKCSISLASTMDISIIRELFTHCIEASRILDEDAEFCQELEHAIAKLPPLKIGKHGQIQEWYYDFEESEPGHRHFSHLYGLHPGTEITHRTPDLMNAAKKTLELRLENGGGHTGWSCAWLINQYARMGDGDGAYSFIRTLLERSTHPNLFDDHPPFQIDGNFGGTAGIAEMLLQSQNNVIELLPALPSSWQEGKVTGLRARGGFTVNITWSEGKLVSAEVVASAGRACRITYKSNLEIVNEHGQNIELQNDSFIAEAGHKYKITICKN